MNDDNNQLALTQKLKNIKAYEVHFIVKFYPLIFSPVNKKQMLLMKSRLSSAQNDF